MFVQQLSGGRIRLMTSASDLTAASVCEFAFSRRVDAKLGRDVAVPPDDDPMPVSYTHLDVYKRQIILREHKTIH